MNKTGVIGDPLPPSMTTDDLLCVVTLSAADDGACRVYGEIGTQLLAYALRRQADVIDPPRGMTGITTAKIKNHLWSVLEELTSAMMGATSVAHYDELYFISFKLRTVIGAL